jgi:hypothetical protein
VAAAEQDQRRADEADRTGRHRLMLTVDTMPP